MLKYSIPIFLIVLCFHSCEADNVDYGYGEYYVEIATALGGEDFQLDNGNRIVNINSRYPTSFLAGRRVYMNFSYIENSAEKIKLRAAYPIVQGALNKVEEERILNHPDDPVKFESVWIGSSYLNSFFYIEHKSETHGVVLWTDENKLNRDTIDIFFLHDKNNDERGVFSHMKVSFDLSSVLGEPEKNKNLRVHFNTSNFGNTFYEFNY